MSSPDIALVRILFCYSLDSTLVKWLSGLRSHLGLLIPRTGMYLIYSSLALKCYGHFLFVKYCSVYNTPDDSVCFFSLQSIFANLSRWGHVTSASNLARILKVNLVQNVSQTVLCTCMHNKLKTYATSSVLTMRWLKIVMNWQFMRISISQGVSKL